ncbi:MarR family winged helix-turn-helix transcriptional regulator [Pedobacter sp. PWIIR3]
MKSYDLIHQLITLVEQMEHENPTQVISIQDFTGFLLSKVGGDTGSNANKEIRFGQNDKDALDIAYQLDNNIGRLFVFMSRYAKHYIKKALEGTPLQAPEDFTALAILLTHTHLSKGELINHNLQEKTSGTEVIRRLISSRLIRQWDDIKDKRSKHIAITDEGRELLFKVFKDMNHVGKMITGELTVAEKFTLQFLLQKLETFHLNHYQKKTISTKADLIGFTENNLM